MYDAVHDRLNKLIARNWGKIVKLDLAMVPDSWDIDKWMYYARVNNMAVMDSFNEGKKGAATGKLAGSLNNNSNGVIDADTGDEIQYNIQLLQFIQNEIIAANCAVSDEKTDTKTQKIDAKTAYIEYLVKEFAPLAAMEQKIAIDCGNGVAGLSIIDIFSKLNLTFESLYEDPDGTFP